MKKFGLDWDMHDMNDPEEWFVRASKDDNIFCFGEFDIKNPLCRKCCAQRLRCAIERVVEDEFEEIEELLESLSRTDRIQ